MVAFFLIGTAASAQTQIVSSPTAQTFSVATFKPSNGDKPPILRPLPDGFRGSNLTLHMLIANAYENPRIEGEPTWANLDSYDFEARLDSPQTSVNSPTVTNTDVHTLDLALQHLLKERCSLRTHSSTTEIPAYELVVTAEGPRLKSGAQADPDLPNGSLRLLRGEIDGQGVPLSRLAALLSAQLGRPVLEQTGLAGRYDFTLQWHVDDRSSDDAPPPIAPQPPSADDPRAGIPAALEKQLGLKLVPTKTTVEVLVVDHLERPSGN